MQSPVKSAYLTKLTFLALRPQPHTRRFDFRTLKMKFICFDVNLSCLTGLYLYLARSHALHSKDFGFLIIFRSNIFFLFSI